MWFSFYLQKFEKEQIWIEIFLQSLFRDISLIYLKNSLILEKLFLEYFLNSELIIFAFFFLYLKNQK